ncbi:MAG: hypothetical protein IIW21_04070, partial [Clostridia bacterium]|nr:hypothetical protein [Clostridia bacterium]
MNNKNPAETTAPATDVPVEGASFIEVPEYTGEQTFINPVAPGADPFVFKDDDGTYYLYATSGDEYGY